MFTTFFKSKLKYGLLLLGSLIFIAYQIDNTPRTDDEYLGEQVYWLMHTGKVKSDFDYGNGYDVYQSIYHKLYVYTGYVFSSAFGWSLLSLHAVSLCCFILFIYLFFRWCKSQYGPVLDFRFYGVLLLLLFNQDLLYAAADFRPELMIMLLGFASYALLMQYFKNGNNKAFIVSAICAGLCMFAHLNGLIFIGAGTLLLLFRRNYKAAFGYALIATIAFLPYFADVLIHADLTYFKDQFLHDPILSDQHRYWYTPFQKLAEEQSRFLYNEKQVALTAILLIVLAGAYKKLQEQHRYLLVYTLILVFSMALVNPSKTTKYMVVYLPFLYLIIMEGWYYISMRPKKTFSIALSIVVAISMLISLFYSAVQINNNFRQLKTGGIVAENEQIVAHIQKDLSHKTILAPRMMVFYQLGKCKRLLDIEHIAMTGMAGQIRRSDIDYVVFPRHDACYNLPQLMQQAGSLLLIQDSTQHYILAKVNRNQQ